MAQGSSSGNIRYATGSCSLGRVLVAASGDGVCAILLGDGDAGLEAELVRRFPDAPDGNFDAPLDMGGTAFQRRVWRVLQSIPAGRTASYAEVADRAGAPGAARAVARACAANRLAVVVPCHRVVRADGGVSGYRWGVARKRALLAREARA